MDEQTPKPKLSAKYNALAYLSSGCVAASPGSLFVAVDQTIRHIQGTSATLSAGEAALLGFAGATLLAAGYKGMMKVFAEEERLGLYDKPKEPNGP